MLWSFRRANLGSVARQEPERGACLRRSFSQVPRQSWPHLGWFTISLLSFSRRVYSVHFLRSPICQRLFVQHVDKREKPRGIHWPVRSLLGRSNSLSFGNHCSAVSRLSVKI